jgi:3',5'-cyclic AMP phosphodiesterase CpdA
MTDDAGREGSGTAPRPVVIAHVSDMHLGAHDPAAADTLAGDVAAVRPALTVITGDLTMRARTGQFRQVRALLDRLPKPRLVVIGNHDVPLFSVARLASPYDRYRAWIEADLDPVVRVPGLLALGLESMPRWRWKNGRVSRRQAVAVVEILGAAPPDTVRLLALHHPPFLTGTASLVGRGELIRAVVAARVDLVLAGHTHLPAVRRVELAGDGATHQVVEVIAGTATSLRTRGVGRSWCVIRVDDASILVEERHQNGLGWRAGATVRYPRPS